MSNNNKVKIFEISRNIRLPKKNLIEVLNALPEDTVLISSGESFRRGTYGLYFSSEKFDLVPDGENVGNIRPVFRVDHSGSAFFSGFQEDEIDSLKTDFKEQFRLSIENNSERVRKFRAIRYLAKSNPKTMKILISPLGWGGSIIPTIQPGALVEIRESAELLFECGDLGFYVVSK